MTPVSNGKHDNSILRLTSVDAGYGSVTVLHEIDFSVPRASVVALIGANGAGKTTLLKVASGLLRPKVGTVTLEGTTVNELPTHKRTARGVCLIPEGRGIFRTLSVRENLRLALPPWRSGAGFEPAIGAFPVLGGRMKQLAGTLSGGEQQMLALARAYLSYPKVILIDELSLGLSPVLVDQMFESVQVLAATGTAIVIVEQYVNKVLSLSEFAYVVVHGRITWQGQSADVDEDLLAISYLGAAAEL